MNNDEKQLSELQRIRDTIEALKKGYKWPLEARKDFDQAQESLRRAASLTTLAK